MEWLKQSTAWTETIGPILDSTGAEYTGAVIGDLSISKNGTEAAMASAATLTHVSNGHYTLVGTTGNSDTLGRLTIRCNKATYQFPPKAYMVLQATVFDALITNAAGGANGLLIAGPNAATTFATLTVTGAVAFGSTFGVTGTVTFNALTVTNNLLVSGTTTLTGAVAFSSTFAVASTVTFNALTVTNNLLVSGTTTLAGAVAFQSTFIVSGSTVFAAVNMGATTLISLTVSNNLVVSGTTTLTGAVSLGSTLGVTGTTTLAALAMTTLTASGAVAFQSTFAVTGTMTVNAFTCTNNFTVSGNWLTTGTTTWTGAATFTAGLTSNITGTLSTVTTVTTVTNLTNAATNGDLTSTMKASVNTEADTALADVGLTATITGRIDAAITSRMATYTQPTGFLAVTFPSGTVASSAEVTAIQNNTRTVIVVPDVIERPDSGTDTYKIHLYLYDTTGNMEAPDSAPTVALVNSAGTDRSSRLGSTTGTLVGTGHYSWTYTNTSTDTLEQLLWEFSVVEGGLTRLFGRSSLIVDTTAVDFTSADRTNLTAIFNKLPSKTYITGTSNSDGDVQMDEATGNFGGSVASVAGQVGSVFGITASDIGDTKTLATAIKAKTDQIIFVSGNVSSYIAANAATLTVNIVGNITGNLSGSVASVTGNVAGNVTGTVQTVLGNVNGTVAGIAGTTTTFDALQTAQNTAHGAGSWATATGFSTLTSADVTAAVPTAIANADALLNRDMSAVTVTNTRSPINALRFLRNKWSIAPITNILTVCAENDITPVWTGVVSAGAGLDPVNGVDPT